MQYQEISAFGISLAPPDGWDAQIFELTSPTDDPDGQVLPAARISSLPLSAPQSNFGSEVTPDLGPTDALVALIEYPGGSDPGELFGMNNAIPTALTVDSFNALALQRTVAGQGGAQFFLNTSGRCFCLYVVVGSLTQAGQVIDTINSALASIVISPN